VATPATPAAPPVAPVKKKKPKKAKKAKKTQPAAAPITPPVAPEPAPAPAAATPAAPPAKKTRKRRKKSKASTQQPAAPVATLTAPPAAPVTPAPEPQPKKGRKAKRKEWRKGRQWPSHSVSFYLIQNGKVNSAFKVGDTECAVIEGTIIEGWENLQTKKPVALQANMSRFLWHHTVHTKDAGTAPKFSLYMVLGGKALSSFTSQNTRQITVLQNNAPAWTSSTFASSFTIVTGKLMLSVEDKGAKDLGKLPKVIADFLVKFI
jgi:hypothetical protein